MGRYSEGALDYTGLTTLSRYSGWSGVLGDCLFADPRRLKSIDVRRACWNLLTEEFEDVVLSDQTDLNLIFDGDWPCVPGLRPASTAGSGFSP